MSNRNKIFIKLFCFLYLLLIIATLDQIFFFKYKAKFKTNCLKIALYFFSHIYDSVVMIYIFKLNSNFFVGQIVLKIEPVLPTNVVTMTHIYNFI